MGEHVLIGGAGGFIGGHLAADLLAAGNDVRMVDIKPPEEWWQRPEGAECVQLGSARGGSL